MAGLDERGDISIAIICIYVPIFCLALLLTLRHGFGRQGGWISLLIFTVFRIVGGALHIAAEKITPPSIGLYAAAFAVENAGIAALLLCTVAFIGIIATHATEDLSFASPRIMRLLRLGLMVAIILTIVGAVNMTSDSDSKRNTASALRKAGAIVLIAVLVVSAILHFLLWGKKQYILLHRRTLLLGISCALPFLTMRVIYSVLSAFSPGAQFSSSGIVSSSQSSLSKFNSITGEWQIYLGMSVIMELVAVGIYIGFGITLPISKEDDQYNEAYSDPEYANKVYAQGQGYSGYDRQYGRQDYGSYPMGRR